MRAFIALELNPDIKRILEGFIRKIRAKNGGIKWVDSNAMHLTLKFLGEVPEDKSAGIEEALSDVAGTNVKFHLQLKGTGTFPQGFGRGTRVLWIGVHGGPQLSLLHDSLETVLERRGFSREERPFQPHLTLGRVKSHDGLLPILGELEKQRETEFGNMQVDRIVLMESRLTPQGPFYSIRKEAVLA